MANALISAATAIVVALIGLAGAWLARHNQTKADENDRRIRALEDGNESLIRNLRIDNNDLRDREAEWRRRALRAERELEDLKENG